MGNKGKNEGVIGRREGSATREGKCRKKGDSKTTY